ncbi:Imm32 family immunity protein [Streptomyces sp. NPDC004365]
MRIEFDTSRQVLVISGDFGARAILAENLQAMTTAEDGGHLHIDYFPEHPYLVEGSVPIVVNSPHGGMPTR